MMQTLTWTEFNMIGLLGYGRTAPAPGTVCLIARDRGGRRLVETARFVRRGLIRRFELKDGTECTPWEVDGWMDAQPIMEFINGSGTKTLYV